MPRGDKTGPEGKGPMTGKKQKGKLFRQQKGRRQNQGQGQGRRKGQRRGLLGNK